MTAIETKFIGPTNTRGSRIKATGNGFSVIVPVDHSLSHDARHAAAAIALCRKQGWTGKLISGGTDHGMTFVFLPVDLLLACKNRGPSEDIFDIEELAVAQ